MRRAAQDKIPYFLLSGVLLICFTAVPHSFSVASRSLDMIRERSNGDVRS